CYTLSLHDALPISVLAHRRMTLPVLGGISGSYNTTSNMASPSVGSVNLDVGITLFFQVRGVQFAHHALVAVQQIGLVAIELFRHACLQFIKWNFFDGDIAC